MSFTAILCGIPKAVYYTHSQLGSLGMQHLGFKVEGLWLRVCNFEAEKEGRLVSLACICTIV